MLCEFCGDRVSGRGPLCFSCRRQKARLAAEKERFAAENARFAAEDQGATGGVEEQLSTYSINDGAVKSRGSHYEPLQKKHARVLYSYKPVADDELAFKVDDVVEVVKQDNDAWWAAALNGKRGLIPSDCIQIIEEGETANTIAADERNGSSSDEIRSKVRAIHIIDDKAAVNGNYVGAAVEEIEVMADSHILFAVDELKRGTEHQRIIGHFNNMRKRWKTVTMNIAFTGQSGCGKSSLINALRGLKSDDFRASKIGSTETTMKPTRYTHPNNSNLVLWDLPGVGTRNFPKETYLQKIKFDEYDFIILVSCTRFTEIDGWLAKEIKLCFPKANIFFVRTKVDNELTNTNESRGTPMSNEEEKSHVAYMAKDSDDNLKLAGIKKPHTFMINSNRPNDFDFGKLVDMLIKTVSEIKREALVLTNMILTTDAINAKVDFLNKQMKLVSAAGAVEAIHSNRDEKQYLEIHTLKMALLEYQIQLGIDHDTLDAIAKALPRDIDSIRAEFNSEKCLLNIAQLYEEFDTVEWSRLYSLPFIGKHLHIWAYQRQIKRFLRHLLQACIDDSKKLRNNIDTWKRKVK